MLQWQWAKNKQKIRKKKKDKIFFEANYVDTKQPTHIKNKKIKIDKLLRYLVRTYPRSKHTLGVYNDKKGYGAKRIVE